MNHSISLNLSEADARYEAYKERFPQKSIPSAFKFEDSVSVNDNLNELALFALHHNATLPIFYAYKPIFLDLLARWVQDPTFFENAYNQRHTSHNHKEGALVLLALSRVVELSHEALSLVEHFLLNHSFFDSIAKKNPHEIQAILLAYHRILNANSHRFKQFISPEALYAIVNLGAEFNVPKLLAIKILSKYLNASEASQYAMVERHIGHDGTLNGKYDADYAIDYRYIALVEAKRLSNHTKLPFGIAVHGNKTITIESTDFSPLIVSICGVLITKLSTSETLANDEFVNTENSVYVLKKLAQNIQNNKPTMLYGKAGSGKTFLINQLAKYLLCQDSIVKIHLGEQTDAKLLLGTYTSGEKPGSFQWRAGVLTTAVKEGKWVLVEDIDKAPTEVLSILLTLLEKRELSIPSRGEVIKAHSGFQLISTVRSHESASRVPDLIGLRLWELIEVKTPDEMELRGILVTKFPLLRNLIARFIIVYKKVLHIYSMPSFISLNKGSHPRVISTRDLMKFCSRCNCMLQNKGITSPNQLLENHIYENIFAEAVECFGSAITETTALSPLVNAIGEVLEVPSSRINLFLDAYVPAMHVDEEKIEIGRAVLKKSVADKTLYMKKKTGNNTTFARTKHSKRLMEQIAVAVEMVEPVLLVGETGTGKTTVVQEIAKLMNKKLTVINVSQQTESGDLLGGYKPVNTKSVAIPLQEVFESLFLATFSQKKNAKFSTILSKCFNKNQWKNVIKLWNEAVKMAKELLSKVEDSDEDSKDEGAPKKKRKLRSPEKSVLLDKWLEFQSEVKNFESQAANLESSFVFNFVEGSLVKAVRNGEWLLLDEINLASPDTLESIADLLSESLEQRSILLSERGDVDAIKAHSEFRIFGCMNPSTDVGKHDLPVSIRSRFSEIYVHSPDRDREDLLSIIDKYISRYAVADEWVGNDIAELYMEAKSMAEANKIVDGANQRPHFSIRTLTRTLIYVREIVAIYGLRRSLYEGFSMAFLTLLDIKSESLLKPIIEKYTINKLKNAKSVLSHTPRAPTDADNEYVQFRHYWMKRGPGEIDSQPNYIITPFVEKNLLNLVRATASRKFPVLVQGPTSAGKTSMISYLASITGHKFVRINNHEHTDLQEYLGTYISDSTGKLVFREGVLVEALRKGHWIVLDELNLAPTDVLEALNRLLDDNRELFIPETQEVVHPHPDFMLFATQNPPGLYGGRKVLSRAFRNRFLELHFDDIPQDELEIILKERCQIAPTYGKKIVEVYKQLSLQRQSSRLFEQKNSFATLRDLFRWALREAVGYEELAANGYMLLAERVRNDEEKQVVKETIEKIMRVKLDMDAYYEKLENKQLIASELSIVWTKAMRRLAVLVETSIKYNEPLLLVGETGCGKTTVCQILAALLGRQLITVNAHQNTETGDILGAQRPLRNRIEVRGELVKSLVAFFSAVDVEISLEDTKVEDLIKKYRLLKKKVSEDESIIVDETLITSVEEGIKNSTVLFEWMDGPLIQAMKSGDFFLLDEISLADDSVLERLNSVLEPERSLLLAEKGTEDAFLTAESTFQFLATMNPGGDYGKKELSPALRNRFTEIWVPSMDDFNDVKHIVRSRLKSEFTDFCEPLVEFSKWFGERLGNGHANSGVISLRDILAWVEFINSCESSIPHEAALLHGASMVFIDALGTNNTAYLAENEQKLTEYKAECVEKLSEILNSDLSIYKHTNGTSIVLDQSNLKAGLFEIPRQPNQEWKDLFNLHAPTTAANAMRVIRAMQVHKPILLEGSPGVGKTSLVAAIAKATGNPLIRINLSEQTDLIDLFGSDAPVEGGQTGEFVWRDAPFLRAMKNGEWVLLDEMNLASQSVLEGLNACLDHRGEAYIPELDRSFPRHPDFKVFAAQNPQYQGGGRKGLPKSFVNRFTVVYVDVLKEEDLIMISEQIFPNIAQEDCSKMISFMSQLEEEVVIKKNWGTSGGPWEFNLRDSLRWLSLYCSKYNLSSPSDISIGDFLQMIVSQRFRTPEDRVKVSQLFESVFGVQKQKDAFYYLGPDYVQAGGAIIKRNELIQYANSSDRIRFVSLQSNFPVLESAIRSVNESIPLILTGPTNSGKTELIRFLANIVGVKLSEFAMNSDVDSMDILGGYEQVDITRAISATTTEVFGILNELIVVNLRAQSEPALLYRSIEFLHFMEDHSIDSTNFDQFVGHFKGFLSLYSNEKLSDLFDHSLSLQKRLQEVASVKFEWFDGLLVQAVTRGDWLVLDNANLCNPSVLDRLNSLLETNGTLIINECSNDDGLPRVLTPHPNFRLFLTVDPKYGELSRAMRNRCVEVYMEGLEYRATTFDKSCLGIQKTDANDITERMENLVVHEQHNEAKPMTSYVPCNESALRPFAVIHDSMDQSNDCLASALSSVLVMASVSVLQDWSSDVSICSEFDSKTKDTVEDLCSIIGVLRANSYLANAESMYQTTSEAAVVTQAFVQNQAVHPLINPYILGYLSQYAPEVDCCEPTMLLQVAAGIFEANNALIKLEQKALAGKVSDLSFVEKSAAHNLGREIKKVPKLNIFGFVKEVKDFISKVFKASLTDEFFSSKTSNLYTSLLELQVIWNCLFTASHELNISKLRVYHDLITSWVSSRMYIPVVADHEVIISSFKVGLELTSGFSMTKIWEKFRQLYPGSEEGWSQYVTLVSLLNDFDELAQSLYMDTSSEVSSLRMLIVQLHDDIISNEVSAEDMSKLFDNLAEGMSQLSKIADSFVFKRNNTFKREFNLLSNFLEASSYFNGPESFEKRLYLSNLGSKSTLSLIKSTNKNLFAPYPRILDNFWSTGSQTQSTSYVAGMFTNELLSTSLTKSTQFENNPGKYLNQNLGDLRILGKEIIESSEAVLMDHRKQFQHIIMSWIIEVSKAHHITIPEYLSDIKTITESQIAEILALVKESDDMHFKNIFEEYLVPSLYLAVAASDLAVLGKAWVLFASGCIQLFVPSSPLDPAIEEHVAFGVFESQKEMSRKLVQSWESVRKTLSGDKPLKIEENLPSGSDKELEKPRVFRRDQSIDELFEEWDAFMASSIDVEPVARLLKAAENFADDQNAQIVGVLHNNASNFMLRLGSKFIVYADLNDILNGYIYGLRLGLELLAIEKTNDAAEFDVNSMWPLDIADLMNPTKVEKTFETVRGMSKTLGSGSIVSEKMMLYFIELCFAQKSSYEDSSLNDVLNSAFQSLYYRWYYRRMKNEEKAAQEGSLYKHKDTDDDDENFKELFPDYEDVMDIDSSTLRAEDAFEDVYYQIVKLYVNHFLKGESVPLKSVIEEGSKLSSEMLSVSQSMSCDRNNSSYLSALLLSMLTSYQSFSQDTNEAASFYHSAYPAESRRAMVIVTSVYNAVTKLLAQWPEHATLQNIARISDEFLSFPANLPLSRLLQKMEVIFTYLAEWNKFASSAVTLKANYDEITNLIVSWRKLELTTWKSLFHLEDLKFERNLGKWWFHLFDSIVVPFHQYEEEEEKETEAEKPSIVQILGALNIFMSETTFGEFVPRLNLVKAFTNHVSTLGLANGAVYNALTNLATFYEQFIPNIDETMSQTKKKLEKDVSEVILLASWKDVNIDALKQSSKKSHNNLYKIVRKYRALLSSLVAPLIQAGIPTETRVVVKETSLKSVKLDDRTKESKELILKLCNDVSTWDERPTRLKNIATIENNMKVYVERIELYEVPSLYDFAKDVVEDMERLRKETPTVMNDDTKKEIAALKTQKRKLLSDTLKELRRIGVRTSVKPDVQKALATVNVIFTKAQTFESSSLSGSDSFYFRILDLLPRLRAATGSGNEEVPQPDLERGLAAAENLMYHLVSSRKPLVALSKSVDDIASLYDSMAEISNFIDKKEISIQRASIADSIEVNLQQMSTFIFYLNKMLDYALDISHSIGTLDKRIPTDIFINARSACNEIATSMPLTESTILSSVEVQLINRFKEFLTTFLIELGNWKTVNPQVAFVADVVVKWIVQWSYSPFIDTSTSLQLIKTVEDVEKGLRKVSNSVIISVQKIIESQSEEINEDTDEWFELTHQKLIHTMKTLHHKTIANLVKEVKQSLFQIEQNEESSLICSALISFTMPLIFYYHKLASSTLLKVREHYLNTSKSTFVLSSSLLTLATKGFCSPEPPSEQKEDNNLHEGTGLGDGEGATNNSKDAEEDDDLAEHAQQPNDEQNKDEDEDDNDAVDIQGDMAGDLEETSDQEKDDEDEDGEDENEDLDEEVDDIDDLDPNAIDEKMWDEEAKEDNKEKDSDKMPENSVQDDDNMEANEDDEGQENDKEDMKDDSKDDDKKDDADDNETGDEEEDIGEQEDEVKNEENEQLDDHVPETETLELPEDMNLDDDGDDDGDEEEEDQEMFDDKMDVDDENEEKQDEQDDQDEKSAQEAEGEDEEAEEQDGDDADENEDDNENENDNDGDAEVNEDNEDYESEQEEVAQAPEAEEEKPEEEDKPENGEDPTDGVDGAENEKQDDIDMESATKTEVGEQGEGADNQVLEEQNDTGASGTASSELPQDEDKQEEPTNDDGARDDIKQSLKQLGDSLKEFHRRRQEIKEAVEEKEEETEDKADVRPDEFQHVDGDNSNQETQAMGAADNKDQIQSIDEDMAIDDDEEEVKKEDAPTEANPEDAMDVDENLEEVPEQANEDADDFDAITKGAVVGERKPIKDEDDETLLANAEFDETAAEQELERFQEEDYALTNDQNPPIEINDARDLWKTSELATQELASGLCEQLRLILEPTLATKLKGDYKTGKRLNMKRIISYIASDFRKDKIWLKRTKPSKRQYQIMIAVDDSKSMSESKSTELAFHSIALVSKALTQLESGGLSIVRFGEDVKLVHPFDKPFNQETGARVFQWFDFQQERTDIKQLCTKSLKIFENARSSSNADLWQLQIIISDGVCEDHETIQRLVRQAREEKVMLVFVVIDGITSNESILDMSQVSYESDSTGAMTLKVEKYLDTFPFEFYVVVRNITELPEMLSLILRQYFSEVATI